MSKPESIEMLRTRRSVVAANLCDPGPNQDELQSLLEIAHRVPDHKKLGPWRFIVFTNDSRKSFGEVLAKRAKELDPEISDKLEVFERDRFLRAPLVIGVVYSPVEHPKAPPHEQILAVGAVCQNLLNGACALGYGSQWLTEWYSYDDSIDETLGLYENEKIAGFIYIGSVKEKPAERVRPSLDERVRYWQS